MPTYQYACKECGHQFEAAQSFTDASLTECPQCTGPLRKLFGSVGVIFKGSGFYRNDARSGNGAKAGANAESSNGSSSSDSSSSDSSSSGSKSGDSSSSTTSSSGSASSNGASKSSPSSTKSSSTPAAKAS